MALHPSSHHNTLLGTRAEYDRIMALTDPALIGWVPDTGHILRGGQDILDTLRTYRDRIRYLHLKDVDAAGHWSMLGEGVCDTAAVIDDRGRGAELQRLAGAGGGIGHRRRRSRRRGPAQSRDAAGAPAREDDVI